MLPHPMLPLCLGTHCSLSLGNSSLRFPLNTLAQPSDRSYDLAGFKWQTGDIQTRWTEFSEGNIYKGEGRVEGNQQGIVKPSSARNTRVLLQCLWPLRGGGSYRNLERSIQPGLWHLIEECGHCQTMTWQGRNNLCLFLLPSVLLLVMLVSQTQAEIRQPRSQTDAVHRGQPLGGTNQGRGG